MVWVLFYIVLLTYHATPISKSKQTQNAPDNRKPTHCGLKCFAVWWGLQSIKRKVCVLNFINKMLMNSGIYAC